MTTPVVSRERPRYAGRSSVVICCCSQHRIARPDVRTIFTPWSISSEYVYNDESSQLRDVRVKVGTTTVAGFGGYDAEQASAILMATENGRAAQRKHWMELPDVVYPYKDQAESMRVKRKMTTSF